MKISELKNAPPWLLNATVSDEDVEISPNGSIRWLAGNWLLGNFMSGTFESGSFLGGKLCAGVQMTGGVFKRGVIVELKSIDPDRFEFGLFRNISIDAFQWVGCSPLRPALDFYAVKTTMGALWVTSGCAFLPIAEARERFTRDPLTHTEIAMELCDRAAKTAVEKGWL